MPPISFKSNLPFALVRSQHLASVFIAFGCLASSLTPAAQAFVRSQMSVWGRVVKERGITLE
jgi:hypothetical protein